MQFGLAVHRLPAEQKLGRLPPSHSHLQQEPPAADVAVAVEEAVPSDRPLSLDGCDREGMRVMRCHQIGPEP
jgi:hypothetical protein